MKYHFFRSVKRFRASLLTKIICLCQLIVQVLKTNKESRLVADGSIFCPINIFILQHSLDYLDDGPITSFFSQSRLFFHRVDQGLVVPLDTIFYWTNTYAQITPPHSDYNFKMSFSINHICNRIFTSNMASSTLNTRSC